MTFNIFACIVNAKIEKATYLSFPFESVLSEKLSNSLWGSDVLLFVEFINSIHSVL